MMPFDSRQTAGFRLRTGSGTTNGRREEQTVTIKLSKNHLLYTAALVFAVAAVGCVSEDETPTTPVRDASFLGYSNPDTKQTTCGNCHTDVQAEWAGTKHASAWADLQASGHASAACFKCHTVNGRTNGSADTTLGFFAVSEDAQPFYRDVQCESCHGAGSTHVTAPGESQPIPTFMVDNTYLNGCTSCHNSIHHPFAEQLAASRHGEMPNWEGAAGSCQVNCHSVWGAQTQMANRGPWLATQSNVNPLTTTLPQGLTCSLCHEPHSAENNPAQLRAPYTLEAETSADSTRHLCGKCHSRGAQPTTWNSTRGAHSAQFAVLMGTAGWRPASFGNITGPMRHGTMDGTCATCHMAGGAVMNGSTLVVNDVGHTWKVIPCRNQDVTTGGVNMANDCAESARDWSACATSTCHGSAEGAEAAYTRVYNEITGYINVLWQDNPSAGTVGSLDTLDSGWLPKILKHDATRAAGTKRFGTTGADAVETVAKGARFNATLAYSYQGHADGSRGIHNPGYMRALMANTISIVRSTYATTDTLAGVSPQMQAQIDRAMRRQ